MFGRQVFLFMQSGSDPDRDRRSIDGDGVETLLAWAPDAASAAATASRLAHAGADIIELYRGFDLQSASVVLSAVAGRAPVGFAMYPYGAPHPSRILRSAMIFRARPGTHERIVQTHPDGAGTIVVGSTDAANTVALAQQFVDEGVDLIEICGGEPLATAAGVRAATAGRVPVGYVVYPYDALEAAAAYKASFADAD